MCRGKSPTTALKTCLLCVFFLFIKMWLLNLLLERHQQYRNQNKKKSADSTLCPCVSCRLLSVCAECFHSAAAPLTGIFMVKPISKGNLSPNTTPQETVKIKHGGLCENAVGLQVRAFWSGISRPTLTKGKYINHLPYTASSATHTHTLT